MLNQHLAKIIATGKISHSWLLTGKGEFLLQQALALAQALLCHNLAESGQPCGVCPACKKLLAGNHPDLQVISPDGQSVKIHQTRKMQHFANLESYEGGRQVVIIQQAHTMQVAAANSLLKILEEPPAGLYFILTAPVGDSLLPTILSRVVWVRLQEAATPAKSFANSKYLADNYRNGDKPPTITDPEAELKAEMQEKAYRFLKLLPEDVSSLLVFAASFKEDKKRSIGIRKQIACFLEELLACFRDLAVLGFVPTAKTLCNSKLPQVMLGQKALAAGALVEEYGQMLSSNLNTGLLLAVLFIKLQDLFKKQV